MIPIMLVIERSFLDDKGDAVINILADGPRAVTRKSLHPDMEIR